MISDCTIVLLINAFLESRLTAKEFSRIYCGIAEEKLKPLLPRDRHTGDVVEEGLAAALTLRSDCDAYRDDPEQLTSLRKNRRSPGRFLDADQLRQSAAKTLGKLVELWELNLEPER